MTAGRARRPGALLRLAGCMLAGGLGMLAFTLSPEGYVGVSDPPLTAGSPVWLVDALLLAGLFYMATGPRAARLTPGMALLSLLFGGVNYLATTLFAYDGWAFLASARAWAGALLCVLGQSATMAAGLRAVCGWLEGARPSGSAAGAAPAVAATAAAVSKTAMPVGATAASLSETAIPAGATAAAAPETVMPAGATASPPNLPQGGRAAVAQGAPRAAAPAYWLDRLAARLPRLTACRRRRPTLSVTALLVLCWSPFLVVFYPGTVIWDMGEMLGMFYGLREMTTWHPVLTTWLFGGCVSLGRLVGSDNLGTFLFTLLQTLALAFALADSLRFLRRLGVSRAFRLAAFLFFAATPLFAAFAQAVGKDTLYAAALLLCAVRTAEALRFGAPRRGGLWLLGAAALLACLVRANGLYVVAGSALAAVALGARGKDRLRLGGALGAALAVAFAFTGILLPALRIKDETASGLYSVCFQQSARTLRDHAATVTPAEYAELDRVLDAANLPALYEAAISDPVKYTFRQYGQGRAAELAALARYRQTWLSMFGKYPLTYLQAFVAGNSGYYAFIPKIDAARTYNYQGGIRFVFETYELGADPRYLHTVPIAALEGARTLLAAYARGWRRVPVLEILLFCPTYTWLLIAAGFSMGRRGRWRELTAFAPALLSLGVCLLSPVNDYFRYFLPIAAMCPALVGLARAERVKAV